MGNRPYPALTLNMILIDLVFPVLKSKSPLINSSVIRSFTISQK